MTNQVPELTPEVQAVLERYLAIQDEMRALGEEKSALQDKVREAMAGLPDRIWFPAVGQTRLKITYHEVTEITYDEERLRQRLGERYRLILKPDPRKIARHLDAVVDLLEPALDTVGSPDRDKVRAAIASGAVTAAEFAGAFTKSVVRRVAVMRRREDGQPGQDDTPPA
ncbi:MAG: hypothetical protein BWZ02_02595 [Lentisphaerae bacterium ADurb.BinA184]|nr:MAG: hypothetical protein BWZ02_02595 [Lentisphaerae bacterium ADurb.BinA184]